MKFNKYKIIGLGLLLIGIAIFLLIGIKIPPKILRANELSRIESVSVNNKEAIKLTSSEIEYWENLKFELSTDSYPGETPDFLVRINGNQADFTAMYNENSDLVFFSFISEIKYGILNSPTPGGWTQPLYAMKMDKKLLELLKIE